MSEPKIVDKRSQSVELEEGKTYAWCACGESSNQPFCDGSHKGSAFNPVVFKAEKSGSRNMCLCKHTSNPGFCDGSHKAL